MKYFHRNYFFLLPASALTTVLWSLTYTCLLYTSHESISNNHNDDHNTSLEAFVKVLIYHGVDLNVCNPLIGTALTKALLTGKYKTAVFLIQVGADVNKIPSDVSVPFSNLQIALRRQRFSLVKLIVAAG